MQNASRKMPKGKTLALFVEFPRSVMPAFYSVTLRQHVASTRSIQLSGGKGVPLTRFSRCD
jgi:hypothetical protein